MDTMRNLLERTLTEGRGYDLIADDVDREQLIAGIAVEFEHIGSGKDNKPSYEIIKQFVDGDNDNISWQSIQDLTKAQAIAFDHLDELPDYYTRLANMEDKSKTTDEGDTEE